MLSPSPLKLGLIGGNIAASKAPLLHELAGCQNGISVTYDRLVPQEMGLDFTAVFARVQAEGYRGVNITYPYKEDAAKRAEIADPLVQRIGAINTAIFADGTAVQGHNTDYSGFQAAYRAARGESAPGVVAVIGAGGVGRAIAFGLMDLGARELRLYDRDGSRAAAVASALRAADAGMAVRVSPSAAAAADGADGLVNCTPVGMVGYPGTPLPAPAMAGAMGFDAVYTPRDTRFLTDAAAAGLQAISGYELFFWQGVHAWAIFSGLTVEPETLRRDLAEAA